MSPLTKQRSLAIETIPQASRRPSPIVHACLKSVDSQAQASVVQAQAAVPVNCVLHPNLCGAGN